MSFDWTDYYKLAQEISGASFQPQYEEACFRTSVSRGYYATIIMARNYLRDKKNINIPKFNMHNFVINEYSKGSTMNEKQLGSILYRLKRYRTSSDYEDNFSELNGRRVELALKEVEQAISIVQSFS